MIDQSSVVPSEDLFVANSTQFHTHVSLLILLTFSYSAIYPAIVGLGTEPDFALLERRGEIAQQGDIEWQ